MDDRLLGRDAECRYRRMVVRAFAVCTVCTPHGREAGEHESFGRVRGGQVRHERHTLTGSGRRQVFGDVERFDGTH